MCRCSRASPPAGRAPQPRAGSPRRAPGARLGRRPGWRAPPRGAAMPPSGRACSPPSTAPAEARRATASSARRTGRSPTARCPYRKARRRRRKGTTGGTPPADPRSCGSTGTRLACTRAPRTEAPTRAEPPRRVRLSLPERVFSQSFLEISRGPRIPSKIARKKRVGERADADGLPSPTFPLFPGTSRAHTKQASTSTPRPSPRTTATRRPASPRTASPRTRARKPPT